MNLILSLVLMLAGLPTLPLQTPGQRRGLPPQGRGSPPAPQQQTSIPLPQVEAPAPKSTFSCKEPLTGERDENGRLRNPFCASLQGVVVRASSNIGIANAHITIRLSGGDDSREKLTIAADAGGRFSVPSINPGNYLVVADADGYQPTAYGQTKDFGAGETVIVRNGAHEQIVIRLNPYQTASGTVRTVDYLPVAAAVVRAYRVRYSVLGRRMKIARTTITNDLGEYRLIGLEPGDYYVSASYSDQARDIPMFGATLTPNLSKADAGFVTRYYPDAISPPEANLFTMVSNAERTNLNITLKAAERFKVHVRVFAASNALSHHFNIAMMPAGAELEDASDYAVNRDGSADFEIANVGTGHYSLIAFDKARILSEPVPITVDGNIEAKVTIYDPLDVPGVVVDENGNTIQGEWKARLVRTDPEVGQTIRADVELGHFVMLDLGPASYDVYLDGLPMGTYIKEVQFPVVDDKNAKFGRIRIEPDKPKRILDAESQRWRSEPEIRIVLTKSDLVVVGYVSMDPMIYNPVRNGVQLVLEPDRQTGNPYTFREDRYIVSDSGVAGRFRWVGVPPGSYLMFAFNEIPPGLYFDSQFNERISIKGLRGEVIPGLVTPDRLFDMTRCMRYRDPIYDNPYYPIVPPSDAVCLVPIPREESMGVEPR